MTAAHSWPKKISQSVDKNILAQWVDGGATAGGMDDLYNTIAAVMPGE